MKQQHTLKILPEFYDAVRRGDKLFDVRHERDRRFCLGDRLVLEEFDPNRKDYTGNKMECEVTYVFREAEWVKPGYVIMGIRIIK